MSKDNLGKFLLAAWVLGLFDNKDETAQELYDKGYSPDEIADELDMDEDDVIEMVDYQDK